MSLSPEDAKKIGGSDVAAIVGVSPYAGPLSVWCRIVHGADSPDNAHTGRGRRLEPVVLDWYRETTGHLVEEGVRLRDPRRPYVRGSLDAIASNGPWNPRVVEVKTANASQMGYWGDEGTDAIPPWYLAQVHFYLGFGRETGVVSDDVADVPALIAGDFRLYHVRHDAEVYAALSEAVDRFWVDHVLPRRPPEPTPLPRDLESVSRAFRRSEGGAVDFASLPPETQVVLEEYLRAWEEESAAADRRALWEARTKLALGSVPAVRGLPLGFSSLSWGEQGGKTQWKRVAEALAKNHGLEKQLRALVAENTGEASRPFTPRKTRKKT